MIFKKSLENLMKFLRLTNKSQALFSLLKLFLLVRDRFIITFVFQEIRLYQQSQSGRLRSLK